ncbi:Rho-GAP domain-containing protein [Aphelenchoides fujianensis]|nr:Rho-GAP domain-containing protein [Aphelenchoides fujianensis]
MSAIFTRKKKEKKGSGDESSDRVSNGTSKTPKKRTGEPPRPIFGVSLATAVRNSRSHDGLPIPLLVRECIDYVTLNGLDDEGIFRISASKNKLDEVEKAANFGDPIVFTNPHDAACLLKRFLRQLPEHILTDKLKPEIDRIAAGKCPLLFLLFISSAGCKCNDEEPCKCETVELLADCLRRLPQENFYLLGYVFRHSQAVVMKAMLNLSKNEVRIFLLNAASDLPAQLNKGPITELFADVRFEP